MKRSTMTIALYAISVFCVMATTKNVPASTHANDKGLTYFKAPTFSGTGCPRGTTDYHISDDGLKLSLMFKNYKAKPGNQSCNISFPVHVSRGIQVSSIHADFMGVIKGSAELRRSYFFSWQRGPTNLKSPLLSNISQIYNTRDTLKMSENRWSRCSGDLLVRLNSRINTKNRKSVISVDSHDLMHGIVFHLNYKKCNPN